MSVVLDKKGSRVSLNKGFSRVAVRLNWTRAVDLDLHAFYKLKNGKYGHIYFAERGSQDRHPFIMLDQDAGVGNTAGNNEENLVIGKLDNFESVLIATNIFRFFGFLSKGDNFARYDGRVVVETDNGQSITVPLISEEIGKWCLIARIDNSGSAAEIVNINQVQRREPLPEQY